METQSDSLDQAYEWVLDWMKSYRDVAIRKSAILMRQDLQSLEECLEEEARLISQRSELMAMIDAAGTRFEKSGRPANTALRELAAEIRSVNRRNSVLIEAALELSSAMLAAVRPAATYGVGESRNGGYPTMHERTLSLEC